jgi:predicted transcriptional regulator
MKRKKIKPKTTRQNGEATKISKRDVDVYAFLIQNGAQTAIELSRIFGLTRTGIYNIIRKLEILNLIHKKGSLFFAKNSQVVYNQLIDEEQQIKRKQRMIVEVIEKQMHAKVKIFQEGAVLRGIVEELRRYPAKEGHLFFNLDFFPHEMNSKDDAKKYKNTKIIFSNSNISNISNEKKSGGEESFFPYKKQKTFVSISVFGKRVAIYSYGKKGNDLGILVENQAIANMLRDINETMHSLKAATGR